VRRAGDITGRINHPPGRPVAFERLLSVAGWMLRADQRDARAYLHLSPSLSAFRSLFLPPSPSSVFPPPSPSLLPLRSTVRRLLKRNSHDRPTATFPQKKASSSRSRLRCCQAGVQFTSLAHCSACRLINRR